MQKTNPVLVLRSPTPWFAVVTEEIHVRAVVMVIVVVLLFANQRPLGITRCSESW